MVQGYDKLIKILITPWMDSGRLIRSRRARELWTKELDNISQTHSLLYLKAQKSSKKADWNRYNDLYCRLKRKARTAKRKYFNKYTREIENSNESETSRNLSNILRVRRENSKRKLSRNCNSVPTRVYKFHLSTLRETSL